MDTKTPPILQKHHERPQLKKQERATDVSLPPLTPLPNRRQRFRISGTPWVRESSYVYQDSYQSDRPYRVLHIGATPLMHACQQADRGRVLRLLKEQKGTIGYRDRTLRNALHYCMDAGTGGAVATAAPDLVNAPDAEGHTPLHLAVIAGDTQLVAVLLANGADVNAKDVEGHSVLHWATVCGEAECVRLVLAAGGRPSTPDLRGGSPLHYAAQCCGVAATAELAVPKKVGLKVLQTLLEFGADVNAKDEDGRQPILWAASAGSVEAVLALARAGGSAAAGASDKDGLTALHCAASRGHANCVEALVNLCGSQPDHVDDNGCSALHYAATLGHAEATALLLRLGADPNRQDRKGRTPALCAAAKGQLETLKLLAQHGGSLHARNVRGSGVAHEAAASGRVELIKWLARKKPSTLDVATHDGRTPLHVAALHGHVDACKILLDHGSRVNAVLRTGKGNLMTALDAAMHRGHRDCAKLVQMHGGTTAHHIRTQKTAPNKVFAAKLHVQGADSSTDSECTPRRRRRKRSIRGPDLYYEERWEERRTRRRDSLRKVERRDSRSYSEEEVRLSKISKDHDRRTRSESARYESGCEQEGKRKRSKRRSRRYKHEYSESSSDIESHSCSESENEEIKKMAQSELKEDMVKEAKDSFRKSNDDMQSVSDDSLEVVIVKKSMEKTSEKVVSGRRSKTPRDESKISARSQVDKEQTITSTKSKTRMRTLGRKPKDKKTKSPRAKSQIEEINSTVKDNQSKLTEMDAKESKTEKRSRKKESTEHSPDKELDEKVQSGSEGKSTLNDDQKVHYQNDVTDSTSQEAVEHVTTTAMVHKDQTPDTPKSTMDEVSSKNRENEKLQEQINESQEQNEVTEPQKKTRPRSARPGSSRSRVTSAKSKMDHILEKADEMQGALILKAAGFKKGIEEMRQNIAEEAYKVEDETTKKNYETNDNVEEGVELTQGGTKDETVNDKTDVGNLVDTDDVVTENDNKKLEDEMTESDTTSENSQQGILTSENQPIGQANSKAEEESLNERIIKTEESFPQSPKSPLDDKSRNDVESGRIRGSDENSATPKSMKLEEDSHSQSLDRITSPKKHKNRSKTKPVDDSTLRTAVEDVPPSDNEEKPSNQSRSTKSSAKSSKSKSRPATARENSSADGKSSKSSEKSPSKQSESEIGVRNADRKSGSRSRSHSGKKSVDKAAEDESKRKPLNKSPDYRTLQSPNKKPADKTSDPEESDLQKFKSGLEKGVPDDDENLGSDKVLPNKDAAKFSESSTDDGMIPASPKKAPISQPEDLKFIDDSSSERKTSGSPKSRDVKHSRPSTAKTRRGRPVSSGSPTKRSLIDSSGECSPDRSAIVAVIESPESDEDDEDDEIDKEIQDAIGDDGGQDTEPEDNSMGVMRVLPSTSEEDTPRTVGRSRTSVIDSLPQVHPRPKPRLLRTLSPQDNRRGRSRTRQRRDSGGRDSGIEPSPRTSRIPKRTAKCYPNTEKQLALHMETVTRDVQISLRRYHLERKIFFQLMELKRLQIRHGRANEQVLVKRQVEAFHKTGATGPTLGVAKYDQPLTFRHFETFLYEQLRRLQKRPATPDWCTQAKQCTQKTHRCHHATSAYTSVPVYTYLGGGSDRGTILPKIEGRGRGQMTVEVTHGEEKQVIALPAERLDRSKRYFVTFTVRGESQETEKAKQSQDATQRQRNTKSV